MKKINIGMCDNTVAAIFVVAIMGCIVAVVATITPNDPAPANARTPMTNVVMKVEINEAGTNVWIMIVE